jgi:MFS family permease
MPSHESSGSGITTALLAMLAVLASVAQFGIDMYLSAFPRMAADLRTSATTIELTLTAFLLGLAVGRLSSGRCPTATADGDRCWPVRPCLSPRVSWQLSRRRSPSS